MIYKTTKDASSLAMLSVHTTRHVHLWFGPDRALCGATFTGHPDCQGKGPGGWPFAIDPWCPECFRPICPKCLSLR